jgi:hypothetical protein
MPKVPSDTDLESLADSLAALLVIHWRVQHPVSQVVGHIPPEELTMNNNSYVKSTAYELRAHKRTSNKTKL